MNKPYSSQCTNCGESGHSSKHCLHPITSLSAENCTEQMGVPGPWYERLPHFKMGFTPSSGKELQSEYFVPRENAVEAILALEKKGDLIYPQLMISEIRSIAADDFWMSPAYQRDCVAIHFTCGHTGGSCSPWLQRYCTSGIQGMGISCNW